MSSTPRHNPGRRAFLRHSGGLALGGALPFAMNLAAIGQAAAFNAPGSDYKALVCVFLFGGNDYANTVVTYDQPSYDEYSTIRGGTAGIAIDRNVLTPTLLVPDVAPVDPMGRTRQYALHQNMTGLAGLFNSGKVAVQLNVGPLVQPLTRTEYESSDRTLYKRPPQLFSHNDQQSLWQSSSPEGSKIGWGGNISDLTMPPATTPALNTNTLFSSISVSGNTVFLAGDTALQYQVSTRGAIKIQPATNSSVYGSSTLPTILNALIQQPSAHVLENEYSKVTQRAMAAEAAITAALALPDLATTFETDSLSQQLKMVARLIKGRANLGARRQVFFVSMGGFDLHDNLIAQQPVLMGRLSAAMTAFYDATVELGVENMVTTFTGSDFGRTLASNGDGSDHGWGSHHFVMGGAVRGKAFYGTPPPVSIQNRYTTAGGVRVYNDQDKWHVGQGRLLPTTSVDQYAATLARWFGVTDAELPLVLPDIVNFGAEAGRADYPRDLGFMNA
jgi:uncharacterized protein (DUF1501 family)